jgi:hypothetical protein
MLTTKARFSSQIIICTPNHHFEFQIIIFIPNGNVRSESPC